MIRFSQKKRKNVRAVCLFWQLLQKKFIIVQYNNKIWDKNDKKSDDSKMNNPKAFWLLKKWNFTFLIGILFLRMQFDESAGENRK